MKFRKLFNISFDVELSSITLKVVFKQIMFFSFFVFLTFSCFFIETVSPFWLLYYWFWYFNLFSFIFARIIRVIFKVSCGIDTGLGCTTLLIIFFIVFSNLLIIGFWIPIPFLILAVYHHRLIEFSQMIKRNNNEM